MRGFQLGLEVCHGVAGGGGVQLHKDDEEVQQGVEVCHGLAGGKGVQLHKVDEEVNIGVGVCHGLADRGGGWGCDCVVLHLHEGSSYEA